MTQSLSAGNLFSVSGQDIRPSQASRTAQTGPRGHAERLPFDADSTIIPQCEEVILSIQFEGKLELSAVGSSCKAGGTAHSASEHGSEVIRRDDTAPRKAGSIHFLGNLSGAAGPCACRGWHGAESVRSGLVTHDGIVGPRRLIFGRTGSNGGPSGGLTA
jgi:hypothetical protein